MNYRLITFKVFGDERGKLISLESAPFVPFDIQRVYYIFDTHPDQVRGKHAHMSLEQVIVAMDGACEFVLDDGYTRESVAARPADGRFFGKNFPFSPDRSGIVGTPPAFLRSSLLFR